MSEDSNYVDQLDYQQLCAAKQRRIDELEGMLEQKHSFLRRGLVRAWNATTFPFRMMGRGAMASGRALGYFLASPIRVLTAPSRFLYRLGDGDLSSCVAAHTVILLVVGALASLPILDRHNKEAEALKAIAEKQVAETTALAMAEYERAMVEWRRKVVEAASKPALSQLSQMAEYEGVVVDGAYSDFGVVVFLKKGGGERECVHVSEEIFACVTQDYIFFNGGLDIFELKLRLEKLRSEVAWRLDFERCKKSELEKIKKGEYDDKPAESSEVK